MNKKTHDRMVSWVDRYTPHRHHKSFQIIAFEKSAQVIKNEPQQSRNMWQTLSNRANK